MRKEAGSYSIVMGDGHAKDDEKERRLRELEEEVQRLRAEKEAILRRASRTTLRRSSLTDTDIEIATPYLIHSKKNLPGGGSVSFTVRVVVTRVSGVEAKTGEFIYECVSVIPKDLPRVYKTRKYSKRAYQLFPIPPDWKPDIEHLLKVGSTEDPDLLHPGDKDSVEDAPEPETDDDEED